MKQKLPVIVLSFFLLAFFSKQAKAAEVELTLTDDTYIFNNSPDSIYGSSNTLTIAANEQGYKLILLKFSTSKIPAGSTINSADLLMTSSSCIGDFSRPELRLSYADRDWNEETLRWTSRPRSGMDIDVIDGKPEVKSFDVTQAVKKWFDHSTENNGVIMELNGGPYSCNFSSKEKGSTAVNLIVNYTAPKKNLILTNTWDVPDLTLQNTDLNVPTSLTVSPTNTFTPSPSETLTPDVPAETIVQITQPETTILVTQPQQPNSQQDELEVKAPPSEKDSLEKQETTLTSPQMTFGLIVLVAVLGGMVLMNFMKKSSPTTIVVESGHEESHTDHKEPHTHKKATEKEDSDSENPENEDKSDSADK